MIKTTFILVMWFGTTHGGPSTMQFETLAECEAVKETLGAEYLSDRFNENTWTAITDHKHAWNRSKCFEVDYDVDTY